METFYFQTRGDADLIRSELARLGFSDCRILEFGRGFAVQYCKSGAYFPEVTSADSVYSPEVTTANIHKATTGALMRQFAKSCAN